MDEHTDDHQNQEEMEKHANKGLDLEQLRHLHNLQAQHHSNADGSTDDMDDDIITEEEGHAIAAAVHGRRRSSDFKGIRTNQMPFSYRRYSMQVTGLSGEESAALKATKPKKNRLANIYKADSFAPMYATKTRRRSNFVEMDHHPQIHRRSSTLDGDHHMQSVQADSQAGDHMHPHPHFHDNLSTHPPRSPPPGEEGSGSKSPTSPPAAFPGKRGRRMSAYARLQTEMSFGWKSSAEIKPGGGNVTRKISNSSDLEELKEGESLTTIHSEKWGGSTGNVYMYDNEDDISENDSSLSLDSGDIQTGSRSHLSNDAAVDVNSAAGITVFQKEKMSDILDRYIYNVPYTNDLDIKTVDPDEFYGPNHDINNTNMMNSKPQQHSSNSWKNSYIPLTCITKSENDKLPHGSKYKVKLRVITAAELHEYKTRNDDCLLSEEVGNCQQVYYKYHKRFVDNTKQRCPENPDLNPESLKDAVSDIIFGNTNNNNSNSIEFINNPVANVEIEKETDFIYKDLAENIVNQAIKSAVVIYKEEQQQQQEKGNKKGKFDTHDENVSSSNILSDKLSYQNNNQNNHNNCDECADDLFVDDLDGEYEFYMSFDDKQACGRVSDGFNGFDDVKHLREGNTI